MRHTYSPVCSLMQQHSYFQVPETASVRLAPTPDTAARLRRAGLLLKPVGSGLMLLRELPLPAPDAVAPLPDFLFPLRFSVQPLNPYFWNFTALPEPAPINGGRTIYYFRVATAAAEPLALTMHEARPLPLVPLTLSVALAADATGASVEMQDLVRGQRLPATMVQRSAAALSLDLHAWGAGRYQLQGTVTEPFECYADDQLHAAQAWAVLEIEPEALAAGPLRIEFTFEARRTRWRYLIRYRPPKDPAPVIPKKSPITVKATRAKQGTPAKTAQANTALAAAVRFAVPPQPPATGPVADLILESDRALALAERPALACTLHYTLHGTPMEVALPAAQGEVLCRPAAPAADPPAPAFSEIVVLL